MVAAVHVVRWGWSQFRVFGDKEDDPSMQDQQEAQMQVEKETQIQVEMDAAPNDGNLETRRSVRLVKKKTKDVNSLYLLLRNLRASLFFLVFYHSW